MCGQKHLNLWSWSCYRSGEGILLVHNTALEKPASFFYYLSLKIRNGFPHAWLIRGWIFLPDWIVTIDERFCSIVFPLWNTIYSKTVQCIPKYKVFLNFRRIKSVLRSLSFTEEMSNFLNLSPYGGVSGMWFYEWCLSVLTQVVLRPLCIQLSIWRIRTQLQGGHTLSATLP